LEPHDSLDWEPELRNTGENVTRYRIYRYQYATRQRLAEVGSGTTEYVVSEADTVGAVYGISAVTEAGEESAPQ